jgi:hypothetical protein
MNNRNDKMFERLILMGAVEPAGMDSESGEMLFSFSEDIETIAPGLAKLVEDKIASTVMTLWSKGFVELKYNEDSDDPLVFITEQCDNEIAISVLPDFEKTVLTNIIDHFKQDEV